MSRRLPFRWLEPTFFAGLLDDPVLLLRVRPLGRALLIDCGQIHHLAKRVLRSLDTVFISHAHMDHFMGVDTLTRNIHVAPRIIDLYGPPGIAGRMTNKLAAYDWNLAEPHWCSFRVHEIFPDRIRNFLLSGPEGYVCRRQEENLRRDRIVFANRYLQVEAELCDHRLPVLALRITEKPGFAIDEKKIEEEGLVRGEWLKELKKMFYRGTLAGRSVGVPMRRESVVEEVVMDAASLYEKIRMDRQAAAVGYLTDIGYTAENIQKVISLMEGVALLVIECSFLLADKEKARVSSHLCTSDVNELIREIRPAYVLPMHLSKSYVGRSQTVYEELEIPPDVNLLRIPERLTPRPLLPSEVQDLIPCR
jgi:ribonuclease Z